MTTFRNEAPRPLPAPVAAWRDFWLTPRDAAGLHVVRVAACLVFLLWLLPLAGHADELFGLAGWFDARAFGEGAAIYKRTVGSLPDAPAEAPVPVWSVLYWCHTPLAVRLAFGASVAVVVLFGLGLWPRLMSVLTYVAVASLTAAPAISYDADPLLVLLAFYLMVGYASRGQWATNLGWYERLLGRWTFREEGPVESVGANVALRLLQVHFALALVASGLYKLQFGDWWYGGGFWFDIYKPYETTVAQVKAMKPEAKRLFSLMSAAAYAMFAWQLGFPAFAWRSNLWWRALLLGGALCGFIGSAFVLGHPLFGPILVVGCLSYLTPEEWHALATRLGLRRRVAASVPAPLAGPKASSTAIVGGIRR